MLTTDQVVAGAGNTISFNLSARAVLSQQLWQRQHPAARGDDNSQTRDSGSMSINEQAGNKTEKTTPSELTATSALRQQRQWRHHPSAHGDDNSQQQHIDERPEGGQDL